MRQLDYNNGRDVFSMWSVPRRYTQETKSVDSELCTRGCEERTRACEAEEFPPLQAVARERLIKTQQAEKGLAGAVVIFGD
jgi:hypothetical protein